MKANGSSHSSEKPQGVIDVQLFLLLRLAKVPGFDNPALGLVNIFLVLHMLYTDAHAILGEDDVLLAHSLGCCVSNLRC